jgi:GH25 family lysozyme M1 (1,4-beta-N-acetylmuramidase)
MDLVTVSADGTTGEPDHVMGATIRAHDGMALGGVTADDIQTPGLDVSHWQGTIDWSTVKANGAMFAYIKATEGTGFRDPNFGTNYRDASNQHIIRGAYHYGRPDVAGGAAQADFFVANGGAWSRDGLTLPGALDIEWGSASQGGDCYGLDQPAMASWVLSFSEEYYTKTARWPVIYTATNWWTECTGNLQEFSGTNPLWVAKYSLSIGALPYNWSHYTVWQYADSGIFPGDQDRFNGDYSKIQELAIG